MFGTIGGSIAKSIREVYVYLTNPRLRRAFSVKSHLTYAERVMLFRLATGKRTILEIGSYMGASACCFGAALARQENGCLVCVDTWLNDAMTEGKRNTWEIFRSNTAHMSPFVKPVRGYSSEVFDSVTAISKHFDLLFIDGDHSYEGVKTDWCMYKSTLRSGSIVVFHDWGWADGVRKVIEQEVMCLVKSSGSLPNLWWATLR